MFRIALILGFFSFLSWTRIQKSVFEVMTDDIISRGTDIQETEDGGYIATGMISGIWNVGFDVPLIKFRNNLTLEWISMIGAGASDIGFSLQQTNDGGYIVSGGADDDSPLLLKFRSNGTLDWCITLGGVDVIGIFCSCVESIDGFIVAGSVEFPGADKRDGVVAKFHFNGTLNWLVTVGGNAGDELHSIQETEDGGYIATGYTRSFGNSIEDDVLLVKLDSNGTLEWASTIVGSEEDRLLSVKETIGGFVVTGYTKSFTMFGDADLLLAKISTDGESMLWGVVQGGLGADSGECVIEAMDGGYIVTGSTADDILLSKFLSNGSLEFVSVFSGSGTDSGMSVVEANETGGLIIVGHYDNVRFSISSVSEKGEGCFVPHNSTNVLSSSRNEELADNYTIITSLVNVTFHSSPYPEFSNPEITILDGSEFDKFQLLCEIHNCFDHFYEENNCNGYGTCVGFDICDCSVDHHYGDECDVFECYGVFVNETNSKGGCVGHGECVDYNTCECDLSPAYTGYKCQSKLPVSFSNVFWGNGSDESKSVQITSDGGFVTVGRYIFGPNQNSDLAVWKFFSNGTIEFGVSINGDETDEGNSIVATNDGGFAACGYTKSLFSSTRRNVIVSKFLSDGEVEWIAVIGEPGSNDVCKSIKQTNDGGFIIAGSTYTFFGEKNVFLSKICSNGSFEWASVISGAVIGNDVIETENGYIVIGYTESYGAGGSDIFISKFSFYGSLIWFSTLGGGKDDTANSVVETKSKSGQVEYIVIGSTQSFGPGAATDRHSIITAKFDSNGDLYQASTLGDIDLDGLLGKAAVVLDDGSFVVLGNTILAKFDSDGLFEKASRFIETNFQAFDLEKTEDNGFVITGRKYVDKLTGFLTKTYDVGQGLCDGMMMIEEDSTNLVFQYIFGLVSQSWSPTVQNVTSSIPHNFVDPPESFIKFTREMPCFEMECFVEYECFGVVNNTDACSGHGNCTDQDVCTCKDYSRYFGDECEVHYCFDVLSNDSEHEYCSGHGKCIDHDTCVCDLNYMYHEDCSMWKCFGLWKNDSVVCRGGTIISSSDLSSFGNCTSHDYCDCIEGYQNSLECDWDCFGTPSWEDESCGESGVCVDHDRCNCTTTNYTGKFCDVPTCGLIVRGEDDVCSGHGECIQPERCDCDLGYESVTPGYCDSWSCYGYHWNDKASVCFQHGECASFNLCKCKGKYEGGNCDTWKCVGYDFKQVGSVCNGHGDCTSPESCECRFGFSGKSCDNNMLYLTVMTPVLSLSGISFLVCVVLSCGAICCLCCAGFLFLDCCLFYLGITVCRQKKGLKKFGKLQNFELLMKEQELEQDESIAHFRINKSLFEIKFEEIETISILGEGGSNSVVFKARWNGLFVAFKCFKTRHIMTSQESFDEFEREVQILGSLSHPYIIRFFGATMKPPRIGIVMEFASKGEIYEFFKKFREMSGSRYPIFQKIRMISQIANSLGFLHSRNIIHRDIKSENILIDEKEDTKLMDFGLSRIIENNSVAKTARIGTDVYMAPEVVTNSNYSEKCDIFSYSILLYILFTENPQPYGTRFGVEMKVANDKHFRPDISKLEYLNENHKWIVDIIVKCWDNDPEERYSFEELKKIIEERSGKTEDGGKTIGKKERTTEEFDRYNQSSSSKNEKIMKILKKKEYDELSKEELIKIVLGKDRLLRQYREGKQ